MEATPYGPGWPTQQQEWLLQAALWEGPRAADAWRRWKAAVDIDQLDGPSQGMLPLVHWNLTRQKLDDPLLPWCKGFYRRAWYFNQLTFHHMAGVLRALREAGIRRLLLLKGTALVLTHYRDYGLRPMGDFDFQVPLDQAPAATAMLVHWGWRPKSPLPRLHGWDFTDAQDRKLDLHWYALYDNSRPGIDDDFWAAAFETKLADVPVSVLSATDQLLHICAHGVRFRETGPLRWIADAVTILKTTTLAGIDWRRLTRAAQRRGLAALVGEGLTYLRDRMEMRVPPKVLKDLCPPPTARPPSIALRLRNCWRNHGFAGVVRKALHKGARTLAG